MSYNSSLNETSDPELIQRCTKLLDELDEFMADDFNTAKVLANLFELVPVINSINDGLISVQVIGSEILNRLQNDFKRFLEDIFGLKEESRLENGKLDGVLQLLINIRKDAKARKDFTTSDKIRNQLLELGIQLKDEKGGGVSWSEV